MNINCVLFLVALSLAPLGAVQGAAPEFPRDVQRLGVEQVLFVKRLTYSANHYYTEYINSAWTPGGTLCLLTVKDGSVRDVVTDLKDGVFERFDLSFDAKRIVFAWKKGPQDGYRIYEVSLDGTGLRQLTFPQTDEDELVKKYRVDGNYHHGTDDMQPCYLPDGGVAFISTRCQYGILCDGPDNFTTTVIYRMDRDGKNMRKLSNSSVSEASPVVLPDGRILYTRWEYVDKGAVSVKGLWAMRSDGSGSSEISGNDIALPPTLIYGRPIPDVQNHYVVLGTPHFPQNGVGTVIRLDMNKDIRSREPMTYMTPDVDIKAEGGFAFRKADGSWERDGNGRGSLFKDPYPLAKNVFLVAHKPEGALWKDPVGYGLYLLNEQGQVTPVYRDPTISCWLPYPVRPRVTPPVPAMSVNAPLAAKNQALCMVSDVYHGLENVKRGDVAYLRVIEQVPRPWAARRSWGGDVYDQQHACITKDTHLALKVLHGIVPVEDDGSACFVVPANANILLQVLDKNYLALQTERTFVDYMPGEVRGCVGCHEVPQSVSSTTTLVSRKAMKRPPSEPGPQPGETNGRRTLDYISDVQPVMDRHCLKCHGAENPKGKLNLSGTLTKLFNVSYESLLPDKRRVLGPVIGENHPKTGNVEYLPAKSLGSHASVLVAMLTPGAVQLADPEQAERAKKLREIHKELRLSLAERLKITTWVDTNFQYYGSYWGRRNLQYAELPDFRPVSTFEQARSVTEVPITSAPAAVSAAPAATREIKLTGQLLLYPVSTEKRKGMLSVRVDGVLVHNLEGHLAQTKEEVKWWAYLDMSEYVGKTASVSFSSVPNGAGLALIESSDTERHLLPLYDEKMRPQFHHSQKQGWNNDPNGMVYADGEYHLFWQCNPVGNQWGNMYWGHSTSPDMIHWSEQRRALRPFGGAYTSDRHPSMANKNCYSGSANVDVNNTGGWQTGKEKVLVAVFTDTGCGEALAYSNDRGMNWTYYAKNPIIEHKGRDPKLVWYQPAQHWVIAVYDQPQGKKNEGNIAFYSSKNIKDWTLNSHLPGYFECPELFELPVDPSPSSDSGVTSNNKQNTRWVVFGANAKYAVGTFDGKTFTPEHEGQHTLHTGSFYASQCFSCPPDGRVVQMGWAKIGMGEDMPFNQAFTLPINLTLKKTPEGIRMFANPIKEVDSLRDGQPQILAAKTVTAESPVTLGVDGQLVDILVTIKNSDAKTVSLSFGRNVLTYTFSTGMLDKMPVSLKDGMLKLRILVDRPMFEVVANDGQSYRTARREDGGEPLGMVTIKTEGGSASVESLEVYKMKSIWKVKREGK